MGDNGHSGQAAYRSSGVGVVSSDEVRAQLERVLAGPAFRTSKRCQQLLRYLVESALDGHAAQLKERTIGLEVFGRPPSYDPSVDSTVRVKTGDVRRRLERHYASIDGGDRVRIDLPAGSYVPQFTAIEKAAPPARSRPWLRRAVPVLLVVLALGAAATFSLSVHRGSDRTLREFWAPFRGDRAVAVRLPFVPVHGAGGLYVGASETLAADSLHSALDRIGLKHRLVIGNDGGVSEPFSVLIGDSYTHWPELSRDLRYSIDRSGWPKRIVDRGRPTPWSVEERDKTEQDYALVSRVVQPGTGKALVLLGGIGDKGTEAAATLVSSDALLSEALRGTPADWQAKNLQWVARVPVDSGQAGTPEVVARHYW